MDITQYTPRATTPSLLLATQACDTATVQQYVGAHKVGRSAFSQLDSNACPVTERLGTVHTFLGRCGDQRYEHHCAGHIAGDAGKSPSIHSCCRSNPTACNASGWHPTTPKYEGWAWGREIKRGRTETQATVVAARAGKPPLQEEPREQASAHTEE